MELMLERTEQRMGAVPHLYPLDLTLVPRAVTVLLGATQAGKTTLMRVMAGLDVPAKGRVLADGQDVTGKPVRERNVAMVYQQFINYPSMTVADNIASPLRLRKEKNIDARVDELAAKLHIEPFLKRLPAEQRHVFVENELEGRTLRELAEESGESIKTLISRKRYAVQALRKRLQRLYLEYLDYTE